MKDLKKHIETLAGENNKTEIEIITDLQAAAAALDNESMLDTLCEVKDHYIYNR